MPIEKAVAAAHREVFDALDEAFCLIEMIFDDEGAPIDYLFLEVNRAFEDHFGLSNVRGRTIGDVVPQIESRWIDTYGRVASSRKPIRFVDEISVMHRWFDVYAWPLGRPEGHHVAIHFTDITQRKLSEEQLSVRSKQFHTLVHKAPIGVTLIDTDLKIVQANPTAQKMFGDVGELVGRDYGQFLRAVWPRELATKVAQIAHRMLLTGVSHYEPEMAVVHADRGATDYYDWRMDRIQLADGLDGIVCYVTDVSRQARSRHALTASEHRYRTRFETIEEGFGILEVVFDEQERPIDYRFIEVNAAFARHSGFAEPLNRTITELLPGVEPFWFDAFGSVVLTGEATRLVAHVESLERWFDVYAFLVEESDERKVAVLFSDVTEEKQAELAVQESVSLLRYHAHHDALTGLPNRLLFEERLNEAVATADRHGRPFGVLFLDLDGFKAINDELGHSCGDAVLIEIARRLRRSLRASDFLARIHGDEFVFILHGISEAHQARSMAQKLLASVRAPIKVSDTKVRVLASIGIAMYPDDGTTANALLRAADTAMYSVKAGRRNAVGHATAASGSEAAARAAGEPLGRPRTEK